jgi:hypothetical protein
LSLKRNSIKQAAEEAPTLAPTPIRPLGLWGVAAADEQLFSGALNENIPRLKKSLITKLAAFVD